MTTDDALTPLSGWTDDEITQDAVRATGVLYAAATLEELALIELVERLNELLQNKLLSIGVGRASDGLHTFWDSGYKRMPPRRRAAIFARVLGTPGDDANAQFPDLFEQLVAALAEGDAVQPAAEALRDNLAEHTDEATTKAAVELRATHAQIADVLSDLELRTAWRAASDDMWKLVENVLIEWGTPSDVQNVRTRATAGATILRRLPELAAGADPDDGVVAAAKQWLPAKSAAA